MERHTDRIARPVYSLLYEDEDARVCKDIPEDACQHQPRNFVMSAIALTLTKSGDRLADPKITLAWLMSALGAPALLIGFLAPIRESLALLPQLFIARAIRQRPRRKFFWAIGSLGQAASLLVMALTAFSLTGLAAGLVILLALASFALFRGLCSVSHKDVLGKTVSKTRRGGVSGYASTLSGLTAGVIGLGFVLFKSNTPDAAILAVLLILAASLWGLAALAYLQLAEAKGATEGGGNAITEAVRQLSILKTDRPFRNFVIARTGFLSTALALPFIVVISQNQTGSTLSGLGGFLFVNAAASALGGWVWGRFSDRSSRWVLISSGLIAGIALGLPALALLVDSPLTQTVWLYLVSAFGLALAHEGVRQGRSTYIVDLATEETRAAYTAVSNTLIGVFLLIAGLITGLAFGSAAISVLVLLTVGCFIAAGLSARLKPVSG